MSIQTYWLLSSQAFLFWLKGIVKFNPDLWIKNFSFAFAETKSKEEVAKAVKLMDSQEINGRRLRVRSSHAKEKKDQETSPKR